ncbi:alpha/beta hydrolase family esterase [Neotabrizicola sp. sgz301269]|uniref:alpha/beta hydrolase family esterase n=1 Tax=Neotabrizicola sp. sgz301269 TaxID=3276282 RepID=UPI0037700F6E
MPRPETVHLGLAQGLRACAGYLFVLLLLALPVCAQDRVAIGDRYYLADLPDNSKGAPLIVALHGGGGDPAQFRRASGLAAEAVLRGYAVIFPAGSSRRGGDRLLTWNGGYCCGYAARTGVADEAFLKAVIADAVSRYGLDPDRVFVTGMSNGSILAETFAATNPRAIRAVAGVSGSMDAAHLKLRAPVPALLIHGTADAMVPYGGGVGEDSLTRTDFASVAQVVGAFLAPWPGPLARTDRRVDHVADDGTALAISDWTDGGRPRLRLITIEGGAHHWPGGHKARLTSGKTRELTANGAILDFFDLYR